MNIYLFELKNVIKSWFWWTFSIITILVIFMLGIYPLFLESGKELISIFNNFPPKLMVALGLNLEKLFNVEAFYAFSYIYIGLMSAIMAVSITVNVFSREKRNSCLDFIFTKPIDRISLYLYKLYTCLTIIIVNNLIIISIALIIFFTKDESYSLSFQGLQLILSTFYTQLVFMAIGIFVSVMLRKIRSVSNIATSTGIIAFMLSTLMNLLEKDFIYIFAPLKYFEPKYIIESGSYDTKLVIFSIILSIVLIFTSMKKYCSEDISYV